MAGLERAGTGPIVDWAVAARALPGQAVTGDAAVVKELAGAVLLAVVDGLGHGRDAAEASAAAVACLEAHAGAPLVELFARCHEALGRSRGVTMTCAVVGAAGSVTWAGIGDVEAVVVRGAARARADWLFLRHGVVGYRMPSLREAALPLTFGDTLVMCTDGIRGGFSTAVDPHRPPDAVAADVLAQFGKTTDDALVLAARYVGRSSGPR